MASGLNSLKTSGFLNGTGLLTGYGSGMLYDKYGSSGYNFSSGLLFYDWSFYLYLFYEDLFLDAS